VIELLDIKAIVVVFFIFVPLEHLLPTHDGRRYLRRGLVTDVLHFFITGLLFKLAFLAALVVALAAINATMPSIIGETVRGQPIWLQTIEIIVISDIGFYIAHRLQHAVPFLWKFHAIHHSIEELDALAAHRVHPLDQLVLKTISLLPIYAIGFSVEAFVIANLIYFWQALLIHSNVRIGFGPLKWVVASPLFHHWHHANDSRAYDKNFAGQLSIIDALCGTMYMPDRMPLKYGTDEPVPDAYHRQLAYPFKQFRKMASLDEARSAKEKIP
jgi:sterol desaturase/sphingolipid hydroxylase (fatty acid hydroxylase superfamily)